MPLFHEQVAVEYSGQRWKIDSIRFQKLRDPNEVFGSSDAQRYRDQMLGA
jgi:hypothetical protein